MIIADLSNALNQKMQSSDFRLTPAPAGNREVFGLNADKTPMSAVVQKPKKMAPRANELANRFAKFNQPAPIDSYA